MSLVEHRNVVLDILQSIRCRIDQKLHQTVKLPKQRCVGLVLFVSAQSPFNEPMRMRVAQVSS